MNNLNALADTRSAQGTVSASSRYILPILLLLGFAWRAYFMYRDVSWITNFWLFEDFGYSLKIAKNIALGLGETFDGVVPTNGYQPLYVWLMVPVFWVFQTDLLAPIYMAVTLLALANVATGFAIHSILKRLTGNEQIALLGVAFWMFNFAIAKDGTNGLEAGLSTMLAAFTINYFLGSNEHNVTTGRAFRLGLLLGVSFLGRVDAVFLAAAVVATIAFWTPGSLRDRGRFVIVTVAAFALIAAPYALWNLAHFGSPLPTSGQVTSGKSSLFALANMSFAQIEFNLRYGLYILSRIVSGSPTVNGWVAAPPAESSGALGVLLSILFCIGIFIVNRAALGKSTRRNLYFLFLLGAMYFYGYTIHTFVAFERYFLPVVLILILVYAVCMHLLFWRSGDRVNISLGLAICLIAGALTTLGAAMFIKGEFPQPFGWRDGTTALNRIAQSGDTVAALQAGNLGYFYTQGRAINLDGVVNMDAYAARKNGTLDQYIAQQKVKYLADEGGWVFNVAKDIHDPQRRTSFLAGLKLVHKSPDYLFNIYEVNTANYVQLHKLQAQQPWERRNHSDMMEGSALFAFQAGARLKFTSTRCFDLKFLRHDWSGIVTVYRDGVPVRDIDLYSKTPDPSFKSFFEQNGEPHEYVIEVAGKKHPDSHATEVWFDAVLERASCPAPTAVSQN